MSGSPFAVMDGGAGTHPPRAPGRTHPAHAALRLRPGTLLLGGLLIANQAWAAVWPSPLTATVALLLWLLAVQRLYAANPSVPVMFCPFLVVHLSVLVSLIAIEGGAYMKEMGSTGDASSASASYAVYSLLFLLSGAAVYSRRQVARATSAARITSAAPSPERGRARAFPLLWAGAVIVLFIDAYLALAGVRHGFPLLTGIDRFQYRRESADVLTGNFLMLKFVVAALAGCGAAFAATGLQRAAHHAAFAGYLLLSFLFGDKFFVVLAAASFYAMPFFVRTPDGVARTLRRLAPFALLAVACVSTVTLYIYSDRGVRSLDSTLARLGDRVAGQGELWFLAVRDSSHAASLDTGSVGQNIANLFANPAYAYAFDHRLAAFHFVARYSPSQMYLSFLHNAGTVTPTMVFEAYGLVLFGYLGLAAAMLLMGAVTGLLLHWLARATAGGNPIDVLLPAFVVTQALSVMTQGTLYALLGLSAFKAYAAFLVLQVATRSLLGPRRAAQAQANIAQAQATAARVQATSAHAQATFSGTAA